MRFIWPNTVVVVALAVVALAAAVLVTRRRVGNFPYLPWPLVNLLIHDVGHALTGLAVAEGLIWGLGVAPLYAYAAGAIGMPVAQETADYLRFNVVRGRGGWPGYDSLHDPVTYQAVWAGLALRVGEPVLAAVVGVVCLAWMFLYAARATSRR